LRELEESNLNIEEYVIVNVYELVYPILNELREN